jgi:hypothetical protein
LTSAARELSSDGRKMTSSASVTTESTAATGDADIIIVRRYLEFKRRASPLKSGTRLIGRVRGDSI